MKTTTTWLVVLLALIASGCTPSSVAQEGRIQKSATPRTRLYVRTVPPGATIKIDGQAQGSSDRLFEMPADVKKVMVEVELDGRSGQKEVVIRGGRITRVEFNLSEPQQPSNQGPTADAVAAGMVDTLPPVVVNTVPESGDIRVDPATKEIRVTFSKEMLDGNWSWCRISEETFPEMTGKPRYLKDKRTCVLPVKLEPGKTYVVWANLDEFNDFVDTQRRPAVPYLLIFETQE